MNTKYQKEYLNHNRRYFTELLERVINGDIFGLVMVDIQTPTELRSKFEHMQPLILRRLVERKDLGPLMERYCARNGMMNRPRKVLAQAYSARNLLLITPLLKWYLEHGLIVKRIHWARQFRADKIFLPLVDKVIEHRKAADENPNFKLQGDSWKLAGNSIYGKTLENSANFCNVKITDDKGLKSMVSRVNFQGSEEVAEGWHEASMSRTQYTEIKPLLLGFCILQYSKLRLLKFYYDFLDRFLLRDKWEPVLCDTDSLYIAMAGEDLDESLKDESLKQEYLRVKEEFLVTKPEDKHVGGLMKLKWKGSAVVALSPKTYICFNFGPTNSNSGAKKFSCKGTQKRNILNENYYYKVLKTQRKHMIENQGLWYKSRRFVQYCQRKTGLPYLITKHRTEADAVTLKPLSEPEDGLDALFDCYDSDGEEQEMEEVNA